MLRDESGELEAKLWDATKEDEENLLAEQIIHVTGDINQFRGKNQLRIHSIRLSQPTDQVQVSDFVGKAPIGQEELGEKLTEAIFEMKNPTLQRIVRGFVKNISMNYLFIQLLLKIIMM